MVGLNRLAKITGLAVLFSTGCADELGSASGDTDSGAETQTTDPTGAAGTTGLSGGTSDTADTSVPTPGDESGDGDTSTGYPPESGACDDFVCGRGGFCVEEDDGPVCACADGFVSSGLDCLPCKTIESGILPADVPTAQATFVFSLDGEPSPTSGLEFGRITLRNRSSGDVVHVGRTNATPSLLMVPGLYDVQYEYREGNKLPKNSASLLHPVHVPPGDTEVFVDIQTATLRGSISLAGSQASAPGLNFGRLWLVNPTTGDRVQLGTTQDEVYDVRVSPGRYQVRYEFRESQGEAPINPDGIVDFDVELHPGSNELDIDVPVAEVSGRLSIDGASVPSGLDSGDLELVNQATGERISLGSTSAQSYEATLLPGTYDIVYTAREFGPLSPVNQGTVAGVLSVAAGSATQDIDLPTAVISGVFTINNAVPPTTDFDDAVVLLRDAGGGTVSLGNTRSGPYSRRVLQGDYEVVYAQETASLTMPVNTQATLEGVSIGADEVLNINIPAIEMVGTMSIGGNLAPDSPYDDGRLFLRNPDTGDSVLLGNTREGTYAARVVPGTYNVVYSNEFSDTVLPVNGGALLLEGVEVGASGGVLDIDVPVVTLVGSVGIEGSDPTPSEGVGQLFLRDLATDDRVFLGDTDALDFSKPLTAGTYIMEYRGTPADGGSLGTSLPANENAAFACFEIVPG